MFKYLLIIILFSSSYSYAGITGTLAPKDHKPVSASSSDSHNEKNPDEEESKSNNKN